MSHQYVGVIASHAGTTITRSIGVTRSLIASKGNDHIWTHGVFGISVTTNTAGTTWGAAVWGNLSGTSIKIAEMTGLSGVSSLILPIVNETTQGAVLGSTQSASIGIITPRSIVLTGVSLGIGITFGCVVSASLRSV